MYLTIASALCPHTCLPHYLPVAPLAVSLGRLRNILEDSFGYMIISHLPRIHKGSTKKIPFFRAFLILWKNSILAHYLHKTVRQGLHYIKCSTFISGSNHPSLMTAVAVGAVFLHVLEAAAAMVVAKRRWCLTLLNDRLANNNCLLWPLVLCKALPM